MESSHASCAIYIPTIANYIYIITKSRAYPCAIFAKSQISQLRIIVCTTSSQSPSHCHYFNWIAQGCSSAMCFCIHCIRGAHAWKPGGNLHSEGQHVKIWHKWICNDCFYTKVWGNTVLTCTLCLTLIGRFKYQCCWDNNNNNSTTPTITMALTQTPFWWHAQQTSESVRTTSLAHDVQRVNHLRSMRKCAVHVCACHLQYQFVLVGAIHTVANDTHSLPARLFLCLEARCKWLQMKHVTVPCFHI